MADSTIPTTGLTTPTTSTASTAKSGANNALDNLAGNFTDFLNLLTTQLKNQDPTDPLDTNQFTQQLVSFSGVEQQINSNAKLDQIIAQNQDTKYTTAANYVGGTITAESNALELTNGKAQFTYNIPTGTQSAFANIYDSNNNLVYTAQVDATAGDHNLGWAGATQSGVQAADGNYTVKITTTNNDGSAGTGTTTVTAVVQAVDFTQSEPNLVIGNNTLVPISKVHKLQYGGGSTNPTNPTTNS